MAAPVFKRQLGHLSVAVFENERQGDAPPARSISIARRYFERQAEEWKTSSVSLNPADVPAISRLLQSVELWLLEGGNGSPGAEAGD